MNRVIDATESTLADHACKLLGGLWPKNRVQIETLTPDGSMRRFCRLLHDDGRRAVAIAPPADDPAGLAEAVCGWRIGNHLFNCHAPVPEIFAFEPDSGLLVCEDLGNIRLHDLVSEQGFSSQVVELYRDVVTALAHMQVKSRKDFDCSWCWDTPCYDQQLMLERESGYFIRALCQDLLELDVPDAEITRECRALAQLAGEADASFFLHRDFQSRNVMVHQGAVRFIDYQAGRLGPVGYDIASLLIDPYARLPQDLQDELLSLHYATLNGLFSLDRSQFFRQYLLLAIQRNLQILGAFAFLSHRRNKVFFRQYLDPSLASLQRLFTCLDAPRFPVLERLVQDCCQALDNQQADYNTSTI